MRRTWCGGPVTADLCGGPVAAGPCGGPVRRRSARHVVERVGVGPVRPSSPLSSAVSAVHRRRRRARSRRARSSPRSAPGWSTWGTRCRRAARASAAPPGPGVRPTARRSRRPPGRRALALGDRRPRLGDDAVLAAVGAHLLVAEVGVHLDLVHRGHHVGLGGQPLQVRHLEVRHADRAGAAVARELLQHLPGRDEVAVVQGGQRPVDQEQVDVVDAERLQRAVERAAGVVGRVEAVVQLAGDEDVAAVQAGGADAPRRPPPRCRTSAAVSMCR